MIPAPSASIDGKKMTGRDLDLNVVAPEAQDLVIPEIKTDRQKFILRSRSRSRSACLFTPCRTTPIVILCFRFDADLRTWMSTGSIWRRD